MKEANELGRALMQARAKIIIFLGVVVVSITVAGTVMYAIENGHSVGDEPSKFSSIPQSIYWATVTMTTVGYGDIVPTTTLGKIVAAILILVGYSLIIVPTGFVSAEFIESKRRSTTTQSCPYCMLEGHEADAVYCRKCGKPINEDEERN